MTEAWVVGEVASEEVNNTTQMAAAEAEISITTQGAVASRMSRGDAVVNRMEAAEEGIITRWEILHRADSNLRTSLYPMMEEVLPITKLSCADISNFVS